MNRQSQEPNASRQNQTTGSATQSNSTSEQSNAGIRSQAGVQVSSQQRTTIQRDVISARNAPRVDHVNFSIHTGTVVPRDVHIVSVTTFPILIDTFPRYRDYSFFIVEDEIVFVDRSHKIVDVVPVGGGHHLGSSSTSTIVAVDLSEPEIREIQTVLIRRGYLHARADGVWGPETREALISFQRKEGFEASGRIDTRTVSALGLEGKIKVKSENGSSSSSSQSSSTTGQSSSGAQKSDQKSTTGQGTSHGPSPAQQNAAPAKGPSEPKGSNNAQPTPKDRQSSAPGRSTTGQGSSEKSMPGMKDHDSAGSSSSSSQGTQAPAPSDKTEKRRQ
jgi:peptidoglycan hydrolase-like protein with peptidoglycan-binding domain